MERKDLSLMEWLQHLQEELLDAAVYVEKLKEDISEEIEDAAVKIFSPCASHDSFSQEEEERLEQRMKHIGQNGNDGLHYDDDSEYLHNLGRAMDEIDDEEDYDYHRTHTLYPGDVKIKYKDNNLK